MLIGHRELMKASLTHKQSSVVNFDDNHYINYIILTEIISVIGRV